MLNLSNAQSHLFAGVLSVVCSLILIVASIGPAAIA